MASHDSNDSDQRPSSQGEQRPPDLDDMFKKLFSGMRNKNRSNGSEPPSSSFGGRGTSEGSPPSEKRFWLLAILGLIIAAIIWAASGFYVVQPAQKAVLLRFGKYTYTVGSGLHWYPRFIDTKYVVNVDQVNSISLSELMLTSEENIVSVEIAVQYRIGNLKDYLFKVVNPTNSLKQVLDSAVRQVIGTSTLDDILTTGRASIAQKVKAEMNQLLDKYHTGVYIVDVKMQPAKPPEAVKDAFDDVIRAREDNQRLQNNAMSYANRVEPVAQGKAQRMLQQANAYEQKVVLNAQGHVAQFKALLPQYESAPQVTSERMYLGTLQQVLSHSHLIVADAGKGSNVLLLPMPKPSLSHSIAATATSIGAAADAQSTSAKTTTTTTENTTPSQNSMQQAYLRWEGAQYAS